MTNLDITKAYVGSTEVSKLYLGVDQIYPSGPVEDPMLRTPLTFEITDAGSASTKVFGIRLSGVTTATERNNNRRPLMYVLTRDGVETTGYFNLSESVATGTSSVTSYITVQTGDKLELYAKTKQGGMSVSTTIYQYFVTSAGMKVNVYGNVNSLLVTKTEFDDYDTATFELSTYTFYYLFKDKTDFSFGAPADYYHILLPATTLTNNCYNRMFYGCTSLTTAPALPATAVGTQSYYAMFQGCTSLTTAPELPATALATSCYYLMFRDCTSLTTAPELPATTLATNCYTDMFDGCTSLTTAPELPATTLASNCYQRMFSGCTSLTTAPELPATTLKNYCYNQMFRGCTNLNYIKCLATDISASNCTSNWVNGVAASGTFVKDPNMTGWGTGANGIPTGWTVIDADI